MHTYYTDVVRGHYQVGTALVVVAETVEEAYALALAQIAANGLLNVCGNGDPFTVDHLIQIDGPKAVMICNGDY